MRPVIIICISIWAAGITSFAQTDTSQNLVNRQWELVKKAHQIQLKASIDFSSLNQLKTRYPAATKEIINQSNRFITYLNGVTQLDSSIAATIDSFSYAQLNSLASLSNVLEKDQVYKKYPQVKVEGKKLDQTWRNLGLTIHDFNYYVHENNNINIRFRNVDQ